MSRSASPVLHRTGDGPPVLLLHPLGVDRHFWDRTVEDLPGFTSLTCDLPGHGTTPPPPGTVTAEDLADQMAGLLADVGAARAHVLGVSLGGLVAQALAVAYPELVDHLVIVDAVATYPEALRQQWRDRQVSAREQGMAHLVAPTLGLWFTAEALVKDGPEVDYVRRTVLATDPEGYAQACATLELADLRAHVGQIVAPTLVVCGDDDGPPFVAAAPWLVDTIPDARLVWLSAARHGGVLEQHEQFVGALRDFLPSPADRA